MIYILNNKNSIQKKAFKIKLKILTKSNNLNSIKKLIVNEGGIVYAEKKLKEISDLAKEKLNIFQNSESKKSLILALDFNLKRIS